MEDWQTHCRTSLNILSPDLYLFPESYEHKVNRLNESHKEFNKIVLQKQKSKSVIGFTPSDDFDVELLEKYDSNLDGHDLLNYRSKSAFLSNYIVNLNILKRKAILI